MTRTGKSQRLSQRFAEPYVELHRQDATRHEICDADLVRVSTGLGAVLVRALISPRQQPGSIFVPMHWTNQFAAKARIDIVAPAMVDAVSGQPASKNIAARVERFIAAAYGFAVLADKPAGIDAEYWALAKCNGGWRVEWAFASMRHDWARFAKSLFGDASSQETIAFHDIEAGRCRFACFAGDRLAGALFLASEPVAVSRDWAVEQLASAHSAVRARFAVIAGRPGKGAPDRGPTVCSCFGIGANEIAAAADRGCTTVAAFGKALQAGKNCGSCRAEISHPIDARRPRAAE